MKDKWKSIKICSVFAEYIEALKNILFPPLCFNCETRITKGFLCRNCFEKIDFLSPPRCNYCLKAVKGGRAICPECKKDTFFFDRLISASAYSPPITSLIRYFKYRHCDFLAEFFATLLKRSLKQYGINTKDYDYIVPVPLHPARRKDRGYNQSLLIAKILAQYFQIELRNDIIQNINFTSSQTRLSRDKRYRNVKNKFRAAKDIKGKNIILLDDIFTTGSTVQSCSKELKYKGANNILAVTLARA